MMTNYQSDLAIHPGEFLEEVLEDIGMSQAELSKRVGRPQQAINEIIKGKKSIISATALELEDVLKIPAHIWIGLESEYQIVKAREQEVVQMEEETALLPNFPYLDLAKMGLVKTTRIAIEKVEELKRFFSVAKLEQIAQVRAYQPAFRVSDHKTVSHEAIATWLQAAHLEAEEVQTEQFNQKLLKSSLESIKNAMNLENVNEAINEVEATLAQCGVALVLLPHFKGTKVHGATFWANSNEKAVIAMSLRGSFSDIFWFGLFHEIGHILLHNKREVFLEDGCDDPKLKKQEDEADEFAKNFLIPQKDFDSFVEEKDFTKTNILDFSKKLNIKPSILVGRLMYEEYVKFNNYSLHGLRDRYKWVS